MNKNDVHFLSKRLLLHFRARITMQPVDVCLIVLVIICLPVYILFLLTIIINRNVSPFNSSSFTILLSVGFFDIAYLFHSYIFEWAANFGWFQQFFAANGDQGSFLALYATLLVWALLLGQSLGSMMLSFNRFTAVFFSLHHEKVENAVRICVFITFSTAVDRTSFSGDVCGSAHFHRYIHCAVDNNAVWVYSVGDGEQQHHRRLQSRCC